VIVADSAGVNLGWWLGRRHPDLTVTTAMTVVADDPVPAPRQRSVTSEPDGQARAGSVPSPGHGRP
jgi:hypothetical protein